MAEVCGQRCVWKAARESVSGTNTKCSKGDKGWFDRNQDLFSFGEQRVSVNLAF